MSSYPQVPDVSAPRLPAAPPSAIRSIASHARLWIVAAVGLALDLWSKAWAFETLDPYLGRPVLPGWLHFQLSLNPGALFGMGKGLAPLFVGASALALLFVLYLFVHSTPRHRTLHIGLGMVLAGALGNLYDRTTVMAYVWSDPSTRQMHIGKLVDGSRSDGIILGNWPTGSDPRFFSVRPETVHGPRMVVRDFIKIDATVFGRHIWPWIFNVADALLVVGVAILMLNFMFERHPHAVSDSG